MRSLVGSTTALALMTVISVCIGAAFKSLPEVMKSSLPVGQYLGAALMLLFGVRTIKVTHWLRNNGMHRTHICTSAAQASEHTSCVTGLWQSWLPW